jgi:pyruvate formate lyase activating enzyme
MKEAALYERLTQNRVRCNLCAHHCVIADGKRGVCQVRYNRGGTLYTLVYGKVVAQNPDPVEKKPLFHFYPGSLAYSVATPGCNFRCRWCQNWEISQAPREFHLTPGREIDPEQIVAMAVRTGGRSVAYTYTEPTIFFEYACDVARLASGAGLANIYVTNGYMSCEMLEAFHPLLDAANVDLKAFREKTYHHYVGAALQPILDNLKAMRRLGIWLEVTTLVIPGINDDPNELRDAAHFVAQELGVDTPWHLSRFFPSFKMIDRQPTPVKTLQQAKEIGLGEGLRYVYIGNLGDECDTLCHQCAHLLIRRHGFHIAENCIRDGCCPACGTAVAGVGMDGPLAV